MGSVKDIEVIRRPTETASGIGRFHFSDRYSVFDWGEMPDRIDGKGAALCLMGAYCFEKLEERGIKTHYRGLVLPEGKRVTFNELEQPTHVMEFSLVQVFKPVTYEENGKVKQDYSRFTPTLKNYLIPLEIIYRNRLLKRSSIHKRLEKGKITLKELGLDHYPKLSEKLAHPILDVSTKFEEVDRYLTWKEAEQIAGLTKNEVERIQSVLAHVNHTISHLAIKVGLENEDGKIELAFDTERRLLIADVAGTLDESRFTYNGVHVSKEAAREYYRKTQWYRDVETAKQQAEIQGITDWRAICKSQPPKLDPQLRILISETYKAATNQLTKRKIFDVPTLEEVVNNYRKYRGI
jgi:phosphoribosylaminoimidazole-succinocarboxamide synthase